MTLYQFLSKTQINKAQFAKDLGIAESSLFKYINQEREPKLAIAIRIVTLSKGEVDFKDLLKEEDDWTMPKPRKAPPIKAKKKTKVEVLRDTIEEYNKKAIAKIDTDLL